MSDANSSQATANETTLDGPYYLSGRWTAFQVTAIILWLLSVYLLVSLVVSEVCQHRRVEPGPTVTFNGPRLQQPVATISMSSTVLRPPEASNTISSTGTFVGGHQGRIPPKRRKKLISNTLLVCANVFSLMYHCIPFFELHMGWYSTLLCRTTYVLTSVIYALAVGSIYAILWDRQRRLYNTPAIGHLTTKCLKLVSSSMIVVTIISALASIIILNVSAEGTSSPKGCVRLRLDLPRWARVVALPILAVIQQALLLGLVIYPLKKQVGKDRPIKGSKFRELMKRLAISTGVCVASDTVLVICLVSISGQESSGIIGQLLTSINLEVNIVSVSASFASWREKFFPWTSRRLRR